MRIFIIVLFSVTLWSCQQDETDPVNPLVGSWTFTNANSETTSWNWFEPTDSIYLTFDNSDHYQYHYFHMPAEHGTYHVVNGSEIVFTPDSSTSGFYSYTHFGVPMPNPPNAGYTLDKYTFTKESNGQLLITRTWSTANPPTSTANVNFHFIAR